LKTSWDGIGDVTTKDASSREEVLIAIYSISANTWKLSLGRSADGKGGGGGTVDFKQKIFFRGVLANNSCRSNSVLNLNNDI
jgi:hypothetical protein